MKYFQSILSLYFIYLLSSCSSTPMGMLETIDTSSTINVPAEELIDNISYVKLETTSTNLIGNVSELLFTDSLIIVVDRNISKSIHVFGSDGHYIRKIGSLGSGPNEYDNICHVALSFDKTRLHILTGRRLLTFNLDGSFVKGESIKSTFHFLEYLNKNTFATVNIFGCFNRVNSNNREVLAVKDKEWNNLYTAINSSYKLNDDFMGYDRPLININDNIYLLPDISDTIYLVTDKETIPRYCVKTDFKKPSARELIKTGMEHRQLNGSRFNGGFFQIKNTVIVALINSSTPLVFYNTSNKKRYSFVSEKEFEINPLLAYTFNIKSQYNNSFLVSPIIPSQILREKDKLYKHCDKKMIDKLLDNMTEDNNPVIFFYHINDKVPTE